MQTYKFILLLAILTMSCKNETKTAEVENNTPEIVKKETPSVANKTSNGTFLCKINGKDWSYTKASGIVLTHKKTGIVTAIVTFTKQLEKGKETLQLFYDGDTKQLEKVSVHLKQPTKDGSRMTAMYQLLVKGGKRHPESKISGTIDLSHPTTASGNAEVSKIKMLFEANKLEDESMQIISLSSIQFSGIGYSK
ncbi:hypothetical protein [Algibacter lectus]|uniref:Uncharacterized protein n=2 Tax=Algibacter lectus TaxID=221126 RepID=A0A4R8MHY2_9FLAO|nr:hypothetical protein [Algibacter lectus]MWW23371.1 hypothetical protein [Algibacter lectus]TDY63952.1 hypothetical protein DFQ06_0849 [Algibacter lectus]